MEAGESNWPHQKKRGRSQKKGASVRVEGVNIWNQSAEKKVVLTSSDSPIPSCIVWLVSLSRAYCWGGQLQCPDQRIEIGGGGEKSCMIQNKSGYPRQENQELKQKIDEGHGEIDQKVTTYIRKGGNQKESILRT